MQFLRVLWDILQDWVACVYVDLHNFSLRFRKKPKQRVFDETDPYEN